MGEMTREQREEEERAKALLRKQRRLARMSRRREVRDRWRAEGVKLGRWRGSRATVKAARRPHEVGCEVHLFRVPDAILSPMQMDDVIDRARHRESRPRA